MDFKLICRFLKACLKTCYVYLEHDWKRLGSAALDLITVSVICQKFLSDSCKRMFISGGAIGMVLLQKEADASYFNQVKHVQKSCKSKGIL